MRLLDICASPDRAALAARALGLCAAVDNGVPERPFAWIGHSAILSVDSGAGLARRTSSKAPISHSSQ